MSERVLQFLEGSKIALDVGNHAIHILKKLGGVSKSLELYSELVPVLRTQMPKMRASFYDLVVQLRYHASGESRRR